MIKKDERGIALVTVMIVMLILTAIGLSLMDISVRQLARTHNKTFTANAQLTSEAGIERTIAQMNDGTTAGFATEQQFFNDATQGRGTYQTTVSAGTGQNEKIITSIGRVYRPNQTTNPVSTRITKVSVVGTGSSGYSVQVGPGGLTMSGGAQIMNSSIYVGGALSMSGGAQIGKSGQPIAVSIANRGCVDGSGNYPAVSPCATAPITQSGGVKIYDSSLCAAGLTNNPGNVISSMPTPPSCDPGAAAMPTYDRNAQISAVTTTLPSTDSDADCNQYDAKHNWTAVRTYPANLKITNSSSNAFTIGSSCDVTLNGNVYVTGTGGLNITAGAKFRVADSLGTTRPVILVDGPLTFQGGATIIENSFGTSVEFISFCAKSSASATCTLPSTYPTGTTLYNYAKQTTVTVTGGSGAAGALFYAYYGGVSISGAGTMGAVVGQSLNLSGGANVVFGTQLAVDRQTWTIRSYQRGFQ